MTTMTTSWANEMAVDVETYSPVDIDRGVYAYTDSPGFEILLVSYSLDGGPVRTFMPQGFREPEDPQLSFLPPDDWELDGDETEFLRLLQDDKVLCTAYNANFERITLGRFYGIYCDPDKWRCTAVLASTLGLPRSLEAAGNALGLPEDEKKLRTGKTLIAYFCKPCKPTKSNGGRVRNYPKHDPDKWRLFIDYNRQDVRTEQAIRKRLIAYQPIESEQRLWSLDQRICDRGIRIDREYVEGIVQYDAQRQEDLVAEAREISGIENPKSVAQLKAWFASRGEFLLGRDLSKDTVASALTRDLAPDVRRMLQIRKALGKTSTKKYVAMLDSMCQDGRVRGMLQFYGANRTGRWAGRIVQLQNLPQNHIPDLDLARELVAQRDFDALELLYGEPAPVFSELVRTAFTPSEGCRFVVTDFSAIEARVVAWLAGEQWRLDTFLNGGDIYCASAARMFKVPVEKHGQNAHLRQRGKVAELALGYGGGVGAMAQMDKAGAIPEDERQRIVDQWRAASPNIVRLWRTYEHAAKTAIRERRIVKVKNGVAFRMKDNILFIILPSGRPIAYWGAQIDEDDGQICYYGVGENHSWQRLRTYGGKLTENVVQAVARDCLAEKMMQVAGQGYGIVAHVHDEMIIDAPKDDADAAQVVDGIMADPIGWAPGLPLKGGTYECSYYQKD